MKPYIIREKNLFEKNEKNLRVFRTILVPKSRIDFCKKSKVAKFLVF